jgi:hypothetical protein
MDRLNCRGIPILSMPDKFRKYFPNFSSMGKIEILGGKRVLGERIFPFEISQMGWMKPSPKHIRNVMSL